MDIKPLLDPDAFYRLMLTISRHNFDFLIKDSVAATSVSLKPILYYQAPDTVVNLAVSYQFILDSNWLIEGVSRGITTALDYQISCIAGSPFSVFVAPECQVLLHALSQHRSDLVKTNLTLQLTLLSASGKLLPALCTLETLYPAKKMVLDAFFLTSSFLTDSSQNLPSDAVLLQRVHDYLLSHLDAQLPSLKKLALLFGTNEFLLKSRFRYFYGTGLYHFHKEKRLERAYGMLQDENHPFATIASLCGFGSYPNFSKAFKKRFGYSPREASRRKNDH